MKRSSKFLTGLVILAVFLFYIVPAAFAQSAPPVVSTSPDILTLLGGALAQFAQSLNAVTYLPKAVGLVVIGTALLKRFLPAEITLGSTVIPISSSAIALILQVIAWVVYVITVKVGFGDEFDTWVNTATTILTALFGGVVSSATATWTYNKAVALGVPLIGYQRPLTPTQMAAKSSSIGEASDARTIMKSITAEYIPPRLHPDDVSLIAKAVVQALDDDGLLMEQPGLPGIGGPIQPPLVISPQP